jgi:hypothetical protein
MELVIITNCAAIIGVGILIHQTTKYKLFKNGLNNNQYEEYRIINAEIFNDEQIVDFGLDIGEKNIEHKSSPSLIEFLTIKNGVKKTGIRYVPVTTGKTTVMIPETYKYTDWSTIYDSYIGVKYLNVGPHRFDINPNNISWFLPEKTIQVSGLFGSMLLQKWGVIPNQPKKSNYMEFTTRRLENRSFHSVLIEYKLYQPYKILGLGDPSKIKTMFGKKIGFYPSLVLVGSGLTMSPMIYFFS